MFRINKNRVRRVCSKFWRHFRWESWHMDLIITMNTTNKTALANKHRQCWSTQYAVEVTHKKMLKIKFEFLRINRRRPAALSGRPFIFRRPIKRPGRVCQRPHLRDKLGLNVLEDVALASGVNLNKHFDDNSTDKLDHLICLNGLAFWYCRHQIFCLTWPSGRLLSIGLLLHRAVG